MGITFDPVNQVYLQDGVPISQPGQLGGTLPGATLAPMVINGPPTAPIGGSYLTGGSDWYTQLIAQGGPALPAQTPQVQAGLTDLARQVIAGIMPGQTLPESGGGSQMLGGGLPGGIATMLGAIGLPASLITGAGAAYGIAQLLGLQFPWETGPGEGFIAPWTRPQVRDEQGRWVTAETRPDLFLSGQAEVAPAALGPGSMLGGVMVSKVWTNASRDGRYPATVESIKLVNGMVYTRNLATGEIKRYRPKKHIVISRDPRLSTLKKLDGVQKKVSKLVQKYAKKSKSVQAPSAYLSPAERKLLKAKS